MTSFTVYDTPERIQDYRILTMRKGLILEVRYNGGFKLTAKAPTCYSMVKREFGFKGNRNKVLYQFEKLLRKLGYSADNNLILNDDTKTATIKR
jgi:hypothetical protein